MIGFWLTGAIAVLLVLALLLRPFLLKSANASVSRKQLNAAIFRDQLVRLDRDRAENTLAEADYEQARIELQRRVIDDTAQEDATATMKAPHKTMVALGLMLPIAAVGLYVLVGNPAALQPSAAPQAPASMPDMEKLTAGLAKKLEQEPDNLQGWAMLARSYKMLGRNVEAEQAFAKAGTFLDTDAQLLAIYADLAATNANGNFSGKPTQLIEKALKVDPENPMALWLAGTAAFQGGQYDSAILIWERLIQQIEPDTDDWRMLRESIDAAYTASGKVAPKAVVQTPFKPNAATTPANSTTPAPPANSGASVSGHVELDAALKSKVSPNDTVMVIARMPGVRMPVAVLRAKASEMPVKFLLDDSLSMSPQARISAAGEVEVEARISKSGMAQIEPGDLMSAVQTVKVGATGLKLQVNKIRP